MTDNDDMTETRHERSAREAEKHRMHEALAEEVARLRAQNAELLEVLRMVVDAPTNERRITAIIYALAAIRRAEEGK